MLPLILQEDIKMNKSDEKRLIPLIEVIHCIQQQLMKSEEERENMKLPELFEVKEVELEMNFVIEKEFSAKAGLGIFAVDADMGANYSREQVNKVKIVLTTKKDEDNRQNNSERCVKKNSGRFPSSNQ